MRWRKSGEIPTDGGDWGGGGRGRTVYINGKEDNMNKKWVSLCIRIL